MKNSEINYYSPAYIRDLFDEMSETYGTVNMITSFGFTKIWRRACVKQTQLFPDRSADVVDLMSGMGEIFAVADEHLPRIDSIVALDISPVMCQRIQETKENYPKLPCKVLEEDALNSSIPDESADFVYCSFGLKTLNLHQQKMLAKEVKRILRPGGQFSFVEISVPEPFWLRLPLFFYLRFFIPILGWCFLGNPDNYRHLAMYTKKFGSSKDFYHFLKSEELHAQFFSHFFGSATGVSGTKM